jgi:hypothetical protein
MMALSLVLFFTHSFLLCDSPQLAAAVLFRVDGDSGNDAMRKNICFNDIGGEIAGQ